MCKQAFLRCINFVFISVLALSAGVGNATHKSNPKGAWEKTEYSTMGTNIVVEVYHNDAALRKKGIQAVIAEMERINQQMSTYRDSSEISMVNREAFKQAVTISSELFELFSTSVEFSTLTDGAFDITYASLGYLYNYPDKTRPSQTQIDALLPAINYQYLKLDKKNRTIQFLHKDIKVDLGGIAKGYAVDNSITILQNMGFEHALVTAGGDTRLLGDRIGKPWIVGIRDPRNKQKQAVLIPLINTAMSTSGDYERYFEEDGQRYHHIISPKTGKSTHEVQSVSIISPTSINNDALSTAVFVMGLSQGMGFINSLPDVEAIIMDKNRRMHYSTGLQQ